MRIVSYRSERGVRAGVVDEDRLIDAFDALRQAAPDGGDAGVRQLLAAGLLPELEEALREGAPDDAALPRAETTPEPPVPDPDKIVCIGLNYRSHAAEAGLEPPATPTFFAKFRNSLTPNGAAVQLPHTSAKVDYEAEVAFVVRSRARDVSEEDALDHIAGYMLLNDLSARDLQFATPQWMPGKVFDGSAPCGPALVTPDEAGPHDAIELALTLNGEVMQSASTADLVFSIPALLSHLSSLMTLEPGDIVSTGTPAGVGSVRTPRVWLQPGDAVVVSSPTLGRLETKIAG